MRRTRTLLLIALLLAVTATLFAEYEVRGKDVFVVNRPIVKIYAHRLGYKVIFLKENSDFGVFYVPLGWFGRSGGQGEIVWGDDPAYPTFTAFYIDGKFDHVRLYLLRNQDDPTWAVLVPTDAEEQKFSVDTLDIKY
jgi:hypothetical protein